jgi:RNA recognition motif-containing protein
MKLYVGNMSFDSNEAELRKAFEAFGTVDSVTIIMDRDTGRPKGFGFVEMSNEAEAKKAIEGLNGKDFMGRTLNVNEARPRTDGPRGGGPRGGGSGGFRRSY